MSDKERQSYYIQYRLNNKEKIHIAQRKYYTENKEKVLAKEKERRNRRGDEYRLWDSAKTSSKARNLEFSIEPNDVVIPEICPILKVPLLRKGKEINSPCIDRIDNTKGYIKGNIRVISRKANWFKFDATTEEVLNLLWYMLDLDRNTGRMNPLTPEQIQQFESGENVESTSWRGQIV